MRAPSIAAAYASEMTAPSPVDCSSRSSGYALVSRHRPDALVETRDTRATALRDSQQRHRDRETCETRMLADTAPAARRDAIVRRFPTCRRELLRSHLLPGSSQHHVASPRSGVRAGRRRTRASCAEMAMRNAARPEPARPHQLSYEARAYGGPGLHRHRLERMRTCRGLQLAQLRPASIIAAHSRRARRASSPTAIDRETETAEPRNLRLRRARSVCRSNRACPRRRDTHTLALSRSDASIRLHE